MIYPFADNSPYILDDIIGRASNGYHALEQSQATQDTIPEFFFENQPTESKANAIDQADLHSTFSN